MSGIMLRGRSVKGGFVSDEQIARGVGWCGTVCKDMVGMHRRSSIDRQVCDWLGMVGPEMNEKLMYGRCLHL